MKCPEFNSISNVLFAGLSDALKILVIAAFVVAKILLQGGIRDRIVYKMYTKMSRPHWRNR